MSHSRRLWATPRRIQCRSYSPALSTHSRVWPSGKTHTSCLCKRHFSDCSASSWKTAPAETQIERSFRFRSTRGTFARHWTTCYSWSQVDRVDCDWELEKFEWTRSDTWARRWSLLEDCPTGCCESELTWPLRGTRRSVDSESTRQPVGFFRQLDPSVWLRSSHKSKIRTNFLVIVPYFWNFESFKIDLRLWGTCPYSGLDSHFHLVHRRIL